MKSRRILETKIGVSAVSSPSNDGSFFLRDHGSFSPFTFVRLEDGNNNSSGSNNGQYDGLYSFNARFNPSMAIIIVVLLAAFFFMGFFSIYLRRCTSDDDSGRFSRRGARNNNNNDAAWNREATRGLDKSVIESFPVFSYNLVKGLKTQTKGSECTVCLSDFEDDEMLRLLPKCRHAFHPECIDMWLCSHTTCPVCRTDLLPRDDSNPTDTDYGVVEPEPGPAEPIAIVVDNGEEHSFHRNASVHVEPTEPSHELCRSQSTGHSLIRIRKDLEKTTEWYIATPSGLKPGLHRNCSFVAMHHSRSQGPSSSSKLPKLGGAAYEEGCSSTHDDCRTRSERWGGIGISSMNPSAIFRSLSERRAPVARQYDQNQDRAAYLKKTFNWLTGRDRERSEGSQGGSRSNRGREGSRADGGSKRGDLSGATTSAAA